MYEVFEELIIGEAEELAERIFERSYYDLGPGKRSGLRVAAIERLGLADVWLNQPSIAA